MTFRECFFELEDTCAIDQVVAHLEAVGSAKAVLRNDVTDALSATLAGTFRS